MSETSQNETTSTNPEPVQPASAVADATAATNPAIAGPDELLAEAKKEAAANYDRYMRAVADLENFRKRTARDKDELRQYAAANVVEDIMPVLDTLALGLAAAQQQTDVKSIVDGLAMVLEQFKGALGRHGLKEVSPLGQPFDHNLHECISHQPSPDVPAETVSQVVRLGYTLNGRLLRPASVVVSSGPAQPGEAKS